MENTMADEKAIVAEPSSAQEFTSTAPSGEARAEWLRSGKTPDPPQTEKSAAPDAPKEEKPAPLETSKPVEKAQPEPGAGEKPQEQAAANAQPPKKGVEERIDQLVARQKTAEDRAERAERELAELRAKAPKTEAARPEGSPAPLDYTKFKAEWIQKNPEGTYDELSAAWAEVAADQRVKADRAEQAKAAKDAAEAKEREELNTSWRKRVETAKAKYADWNELDFGKAPLREGSIPDAFIIDSEAGPDLLRHFAQHPEELEAINSLPAFRQVRELVKLEAKYGETPPDKTDAKPEAKAEAETPAKPNPPRAPRPASEVGGRQTPPDDPADAAMKAGDFSRYREAENARELRAQKG
jgi:hypothetical protein